MASSSSAAPGVEEAIVDAHPEKKRRSGRYKPGARKGQGDTRLSKGCEAALRQEIHDLKSQNKKLLERISSLEEEVGFERKRRLALEGEEVENVSRYRRVMRDLL